jgi:hypothetical protein
VGVVAAIFFAANANMKGRDAVAKPAAFSARGGAVTFDLDVRTLSELGWGFTTGGPKEQEVGLGQPATFPIAETCTLRVIPGKSRTEQRITGEAEGLGALLLTGLGERVVIGNFVIGVNAEGMWVIKNTIGGPANEQVVFKLSNVMTDFSAAQKNLRVVGELAVAPSWAESLGAGEAANIVIGVLTMDVDLVGPRRDRDRIAAATDKSSDGETAGTIGPDIVIGDLYEVLRFGRVGDITAFAVGTNACNLGDERASWISYTNQHPVIAQDMYRLKDGRFEQIGMSWVKHGFYAVNGTLCGPCNDLTQGAQLGVGCSDPYSAYLNGVQGNMSMRSDVNPHTGYFDYPWTAPEPQTLIDKRLQVHDADLDPELNPGATYFVQGHYVAADDLGAGNGNNSASYRRIVVTENSETPNLFTAFPTGQTQRGEPAIRAWKDTDNTVEETDIEVPGEGLFILAAKATNLNNGFWHYEYALQNLNSDRAAGVFRVPIARGLTIENVGFHDVEYHSGEVYDGTDWDFEQVEDWVEWWTQTYGENPNANALRFGTTYNFRFDAARGPAPIVATIGLFKPGSPVAVQGRTIGPALGPIDCQPNGYEDHCDLSCDGCEQPCGGSLDCNDNSVPDECEVRDTDCNGNGIPDDCDVRDCPPGDLTCADCDENEVPDGCQAGCEHDCDLDGLPDGCDPPGDFDEDGIDDCTDLCPYTTPPDTCVCPPTGWCCWDWTCIPNYSRDVCLSQGGIPDCLESPCRDGCLVTNVDKVGDLVDMAALMRCFSGPIESPDFEPPRCVCVERFDEDGDGDIDDDDYRPLFESMDGP